jgi:hypothetical protein
LLDRSLNAREVDEHVLTKLREVADDKRLAKACRLADEQLLHAQLAELERARSVDGALVSLESRQHGSCRRLRRRSAAHDLLIAGRDGGGSRRRHGLVDVGARWARARTQRGVISSTRMARASAGPWAERPSRSRRSSMSATSTR